MHRFPIVSSTSTENILFPSRSNFSSMYSMMWPTQQERSHSAVHSARLNRGTQARPPRFEAMSCNKSIRWINSCCLPAVTVIIFAHKWVLLFAASRVQPPSIQRPSSSNWLLKAAGWQNTYHDNILFEPIIKIVCQIFSSIWLWWYRCSSQNLFVCLRETKIPPDWSNLWQCKCISRSLQTSSWTPTYIRRQGPATTVDGCLLGYRDAVTQKHLCKHMAMGSIGRLLKQ